MFLKIFTIILLYFAHVSKCNNIHLETAIHSLLENRTEDGIENKISDQWSLKIINFNIIESYYEGMGLRMSYSIYGMNMTGLDNFNIKNLNIERNENQTIVDLAIGVPRIKLHSDHYKISGKAYYIYQLHGEGNMDVEFVDTIVLLNLKTSNGNQPKLTIQDMFFDFDVKDIKVNLENSSWPLNNILNGKGVAMLKSYREDVSHAIRDYVVPYINDLYLSKI